MKSVRTSSNQQEQPMKSTSDIQNSILNSYSKLENFSLDEKLLKIHHELLSNLPFEEAKILILKTLNINEFNYYTNCVDVKLKNYISRYIFPQYKKNDQGHGILHIKEVIRRSFALNETFKLNLNSNIIYAIASCHDLGKYVSHETHHLIAANKFYNNKFFKTFFSNEERLLIKEAIEDHRSSKEDTPRSVYGKLISSADRNTSIEIVFIRSFYVALERTPNMNIDDYLDFTLNRLRKKYDEQNPENMFYEDEIYKIFLCDMRNLLSDPSKFKTKYCELNQINNTNQTVKQAHEKRSDTWKII